METPPGFEKAFLDAAHKGDFPLLQRLATVFENGEGPGKVSYANLKTGDGVTALHMAAAAGNTSICKFLIEKLNFDINITDYSGETPLFPSIVYRHQPTSIFLIKKGADVTKSCCRGITPLHHAAERGSPEMMKLLISKGADICAIAQAGTPLHFAANGANLDTLKFLLDLKADPNFISPLHFTPLHLATSADSIECMELLLKAGANPDGDCSQSQMITPLGIAVSEQDEERIRYLLKAGADPNVTDLTCKTALEYAALSGHRELVELLFPVTSRIACYPDWSISGIMQYEQSREAMELRKSQVKELALLAKAKAKEAFQRKDYVEAMQWYTQAIETNLVDAKLLSNRSLCWTLLNDGERALEDAQACVILESGWAKAHYREGAALKVLKRYEEAAEAFSRALALNPTNKEIENAYREALAECGRGRRN